MNHRRPEKVERSYQIREAIYEVLKDLQFGRIQTGGDCAGLLDSKHTKAIDEIVAKIETVLNDYENKR